MRKFIKMYLWDFLFLIFGLSVALVGILLCHTSDLNKLDGCVFYLIGFAMYCCGGGIVGKVFSNI